MELWRGVLAQAVCQAGDSGEHAEPAHRGADFLILGKQAPLAKENRPIAFVGTNQGQSACTRVGHVGADVGKILEEPEGGEGKTCSFPLPEEIDGAEQRNDQLAERPAQNMDGLSKPTKEKMPAFVDDQIHVIEDEKPGAVQVGVKKKKRVKTEPGNASAARNGLPLAELVFEEGHSASLTSPFERGRHLAACGL